MGALGLKFILIFNFLLQVPWVSCFSFTQSSSSSISSGVLKTPGQKLQVQLRSQHPFTKNLGALSSPKKIESRLYQTPSLPSFDELSQQKSESLRSMSEFHDGTWICDDGAISSDISGGSIMRSPPFKTSISTRLGLAENGETLKLVETMSWKQIEGDSDDDTFFGRYGSLGALADVDSIDGSYSLHSTMNGSKSGQTSIALPESISGVAKPEERVTSVIESCLVATQTSRVRCFMIYGKSGFSSDIEEEDNTDTDTDTDGNSVPEQRLLRVVISHERKLQQDDALDDFIQGTVSKMDKPEDRLSSAMSGSNEDLGENIKYPINMMTLSLGPWLGDVIVRDRSFNSLLPTTKKGNTPIGFGVPKKSPKRNSNDESGFGEWVLGVQKLAITFKYDFDCNVRQCMDYGKSMGVYEKGWPRQSSGVIYDDRMSRRIKPEDRSMYIDYDNGAYCGFVLGSVYLKVRNKFGSLLSSLFFLVTKQFLTFIS